ncbi:HAD family phosphatase [Lacrimispora sp.]|uniref:HAD family hydrolase n=1 Tax=Lacrimispora sp. TaxID=2719234 RepID=UPI0032E50A08
MLNEKKAVIFDLDGTLVDSMWMWKSIDIEFLGSRGIPCPDDLEKEIEGMSFTETAFYFKERFKLTESLEEIKGIWTDMSLDKYKNEVPLKAGAGEFLAYLSSQGLSMGIATSNGREMVDAVIDSLKIGKYFNVVATSCEVAAGKPAPDIYLKVAKELNVIPSQCLVFEDVPAGILAGKRAGMTVCAIDDGFSKAMEAEKRELADYFIYDYYQLLERNGVQS